MAENLDFKEIELENDHELEATLGEGENEE